MDRGLFGDQAYPSGDSAFFNGLDASSFKQLGLLQATARARAAHAQAVGAGQTSGNIFGGTDGVQQRPDQHFPSPSVAHQPPFPPFNMQNAAMPGPPSSIPQQMPGGPPNPNAPNNARQNPQNVNPQQMEMMRRQRRMGFLQSLARSHAMLHHPLPASITGLEAPPDPNAVYPWPWTDIEPASEPGGVKIAGKDVDLFKLWSTIAQNGGPGKINQQGAWGMLLSLFGLPEHLAQPQENGNTSTAIALAHLYMKLLLPFDETYYKQMPETQRNVLFQQGRLPLPQAASFPGGGHNPPPPATSGFHIQSQEQPQTQTQLPQAQTTLHQTQIVPTVTGEQTSAAALAPGSANELDAEARKRKTETGEDLNMKRRRTSSGSPEQSRASEHNPQTQMATLSSAGSSLKVRRKIEYVPFHREIETAGGRDVVQIQNELTQMSRGHQLRDINEWGRVYTDALTMSLRSRLSVELSYALTTLTVLSTMRSQGHDSGMSIGQCPELLEELLDLLEELTFPDGLEGVATVIEEEITTNRRLILLAHEEISSPFAPVTRRQGDFDPSKSGPIQRRADLIKLVLNLFRNLSAITDNQQILAKNSLLIDILLATTTLERSNSISSPRPLSDALSIPDLIVVRKETVSILVNLCGQIPLVSSEHTTRAKRVFALVSSYLVDPAESIPPFQWVMQNSAGNPGISVRAPLLPDAALEVFTRISQPDGNREVIGSSVPQAWLWQLIESLVYRLPSSENDFKLLARDESWMSYLEKLILSLYSLAYLIPHDLRQRVKKDRSLCFGRVMLRFLKRLLKQHELRATSGYCARRTIETLKIIDDGSDAFDTVQSSVPALSFGVGYGEHGDKRVEIGHGMLGGQQDDVLWAVMLNQMDDVMFSELESLSRVEISAH